MNTLPLTPKKLIFLALFILAGVFIASVAPSIEVAWVCAILLLTIYLFAFEIVAVDIAAISIMVILGLTSLLAPWMGLTSGLVNNDRLFDGFASNAVMSIIAVMIIGAGLDKTGIMSQVAVMIMRFGGSTEKRIIPLISGTVAVISSFMQNVGAAALFLPVVSRISSRTGLPMSRLLMPMGFCAILGGTLTMVGSSPLILLNDLILNSNESLPAGVEKMKTFSLFSVAPIGFALITTGVLYFIIAGKFILPSNKNTQTEGGSTMQYFKDTYGLETFELYELVVLADSNVVGMSVDEFELDNPLRVIAVSKGDGRRLGAEGVDRQTAITAGTVFGVLSSGKHIEAVAEKNKLTMKASLDLFSDALSQVKAGIAELIIAPGSSLLGQSARDVWMRKKYGLSLLAIHRGNEIINCQSGGDVRNELFETGDVLVVHTAWENLARLEKDRDFVVVTTEYPHEELRPQKVTHALVFFLITLGLVLFSDVKLSVALLFGAIGMVLSGVLKIEEAYQAVSWKTVFLLASLIPLGFAVEKTGTAAWIAQQTLAVVGDMPIWVIQLAVAVLATFFTLVMSNVGATVLLVPLAVNIALGVGANPAVFALTVGIATSNSFLLPTHQVNALIMGPGGYRVADYMRAGGIMTILFLAVSLTVLNLVF